MSSGILRGSVAIVCAIALHASCAYAEKADKDKPINFSSDTGGANYEQKTGSLRSLPFANASPTS